MSRTGCCGSRSMTSPASNSGSLPSARWAQPIQGSAFSSSSVGPEVLAGFQSLLAQYVSVDAVSGTRLILGAGQAHLVQLEELCGVASGRLRADLLDVGARFTEFAGWLHQDAGDTSAARYWTNRAMNYALELGDARLTSYVLIQSVLVSLGRQRPNLSSARSLFMTSSAAT